MAASKRALGTPKRVFIVFVDHSVLGVWRSLKLAQRAVRLRRADSLIEVFYRIEVYIHDRAAK